MKPPLPGLHPRSPGATGREVMPDLACLDGKVAWVPVGQFTDPRGSLSVVQFDAQSFRCVRAFVVTAPAGAVRGGHGHRRGRQILMCLSGAIDVELRYRGLSRTLPLRDGSSALLIEPTVWSLQTYRGENSAMLVFCDTPYDPSDYFEVPDAGQS